MRVTFGQSPKSNQKVCSVSSELLNSSLLLSLCFQASFLLIVKQWEGRNSLRSNIALLIHCFIHSASPFAGTRQCIPKVETYRYCRRDFECWLAQKTHQKTIMNMLALSSGEHQDIFASFRRWCCPLQKEVACKRSRCEKPLKMIIAIPS